MDRSNISCELKPVISKILKPAKYSNMFSLQAIPTTVVSYVQASLLFLTSATAVSIAGLRISDAAFGLFVVSLLLTIKSCPRLPVSALVALFVMVIAIVLATGYAFWAENDLRANNAEIVNTVAIPLGLFSCALGMVLLSPSSGMRVISAYATTASLLSLALLIVGSGGWLESWAVPDEGIDRFTGLSNNPNQLALFLLPVPFFSLIACLGGSKGRRRAFSEIAIVLVVNVFVIGKSLFVAWSAAALFLYIIGWRLSGIRHLNVQGLSVRLITFLAAIIVSTPVLVLLYLGHLPGSVENQGETRATLWRNGLNAWLDSPLVGHGPGHYSGIDLPYQNMEAHSTLIDWLSAYGAIGGLALICFVGWLLVSAVRNGSWVVAALLIAILWQAMFHFYGRQPIFWMIFCFSYLLGKNKQPVQLTQCGSHSRKLAAVTQCQ